MDQFEIDWSAKNGKTSAENSETKLTEDRATLLYIIDNYTKNLFETDKNPVRQAREQFDALLKAIIAEEDEDKTYFKLRQYFTSHRLDEFTYIQNTFDDFKRIIWDFADNLTEEASKEEEEQNLVGEELNLLRDAVEANSIDSLRSQARKFIDTYAEFQASLHTRRNKRLETAKKNLSTVRKKLNDANNTLLKDHLTGAFNRRAFDDQIREAIEYKKQSKKNVSLISFDIDHFKKVNDTYGHDLGDFVLKELVALMQKLFADKNALLARVGGEEFAIILKNCDVEQAKSCCEKALTEVRKAAFTDQGATIRFTISMGVAEYLPDEGADKWVKRADQALYHSKENGRDKYTAANHPPKMVVVA